MKITIPVEPLSKDEAPRKVYDKTTQKYEVYRSEKYKEYCDIAGRYIDPLNINFPVNVKMTFYLKRYRSVSLLGLEKAVEDVLVDCNLLKSNDSNILRSTDGSRVFVDEKFPRTEIEIERIQSRKKTDNKSRNKKD